MMLWKRLYKDNIWAQDADQLQGFVSLLLWFCVLSNAGLIPVYALHSCRPEQRFQENDW